MATVLRRGDILVLCMPEQLVPPDVVDRYRELVMERMPGLADVVILTGVSNVAVFDPGEVEDGRPDQVLAGDRSAEHHP